MDWNSLWRLWPHSARRGEVNISKRLEGKTFSARSQASYQREAVLRKKLSAAQEMISRCQQIVANQELGEKRQLKRHRAHG